MIEQWPVSTSQIMGASFFDFDHLLETLTAGRIAVPWLMFGLLAQAIVGGCLLVHWHVSKKHGRIIFRSGMVYTGLIATLMLLVYASVRHDLVFVVGELLNVLIALRLLELIRRISQHKANAGSQRFPVVKPDSAERKMPSANK